MNPPTSPTVSKSARWTGWILGALPAALLIFSAVMKLARPPAVVEGFAQSGFPAGALLGLGLVELGCAVLYLIPRTAVLGAILATGYIGGIIATTLRMNQSYLAAIIMGVMIWGGLWLRDTRLRALLPLR